MLPTAPWIVSRFAVPLFTATVVLATRWGNQNLVLYLALPVAFALYRVHRIQKEAPRCRRRFSRHPDYPRFRQTLTAWQIVEAISLILLMILEAMVAAIAEARARTALPYVIAILCLLVPYILLSLMARRKLLQAHEIVQKAQCSFEPSHAIHRELW